MAMSLDKLHELSSPVGAKHYYPVRGAESPRGDQVDI